MAVMETLKLKGTGNIILSPIFFPSSFTDIHEVNAFFTAGYFVDFLNSECGFGI